VLEEDLGLGRHRDADLGAAVAPHDDVGAVDLVDLAHDLLAAVLSGRGDGGDGQDDRRAETQREGLAHFHSPASTLRGPGGSVKARSEIVHTVSIILSTGPGARAILANAACPSSSGRVSVQGLRSIRRDSMRPTEAAKSRGA